MAIQLPPSNDVNALVNAIETANATNQPLILLPGVHFTKPGYNVTIPIGPNGLNMSGAATARIQRPDHSIGDNPLHRLDNNYGISLVPARPLIPEPAAMRWQTYRPADGPPTEFIIMTRGTIKISGLTLDCNMGNQALEGVPKKSVEHNAMLAIAGARYDFSLPSGPQRTLFVGFDQVLLENLTLMRGGFADDVMFPPSYFRPNIAQVTVTHLVSEQRINAVRASVAFTGLSQRITIRDCDIDSLHCEEDAIWSDYPGPTGPFERSSWSVDGVRARAIGFAAKGDVLALRASGLDVRENFQVHELTGAISGSRLVVANEDRRSIRLRNCAFTGCTWVLKPDAARKVNGIIPTPRNNQPFWATFDDNSFVVEGDFASGQIIATGQHSYNFPGNNVTARFTNCRYGPGFGSTNHPNTHVAVLAERGDYTFAKADLQGLNLHQAIVAPQASVTDLGGLITYHIP